MIKHLKKNGLFLCIIQLLCSGLRGTAIAQTGSLDTDKIEAQLAAKQEHFAQEEQTQLNQAATDAQGRIDHITARMNEDVENVPRYFIDEAGHRSANYDYNTVVNDIQTEALARIKDIRSRLPKQQEEIKRNYQQKIDGLASSINNISSKLTPSKKAIQLNQNGTDLYIRNYSYPAAKPKPIQ